MTAPVPTGPWWRDRAILERVLREHGGIRPAAAATNTDRDTLRKWAAHFGLDVAAMRPLKVAPEAREAASAITREEMLEQENRELRARLRDARGVNVLEERMLELLREIVSPLQPMFEPLPVQVAMEAQPTPHEMCLLWSDTHAAEVVSLEQMNGVNEYDWRIMLRRHDLITRAIRSFLAHRPYPVPRLQIAALGDMVTGDIHEELAETNEVTLLEAAVQLGLDAAAWVEQLVPDFERIDIDGVVGNHGRRHAKPRAKNAHDNFDWLVYHVMRLRLAQYPSVTVTVPKSRHHPITMCGKWRCVMSHGDGVRSTMVGVPWGGLIRRSKELERQFEPHLGPIHHFFFGHFHELNATNDFRIIVNGSVKGPDEYSLHRYGAGAQATQALLFFHPRRGLTDIARVDMREAG